MTATQLLVWLNGGGNGEIDAVCVGQAWQDVTGVAAIPAPPSALLGGVTLLGHLRRRRS